VRHPGGFCFLMLDWAKEEMAISIEELGGILPVAKASLSELQKGLAQWFLQPQPATRIAAHSIEIGLCTDMMSSPAGSLPSIPGAGR